MVRRAVSRAEVVDVSCDPKSLTFRATMFLASRCVQVVRLSKRVPETIGAESPRPQNAKWPGRTETLAKSEDLARALFRWTRTCQCNRSSHMLNVSQHAGNYAPI